MLGGRAMSVPAPSAQCEEGLGSIVVKAVSNGHAALAFECANRLLPRSLPDRYTQIRRRSGRGTLVLA
jgi:hypothetical protein